MASTYSESPFSSSSSSSRHRWNYDVFLSCRREDTRKNFTDHLYTALIQAGIHTFRDDNELPRGEEISPQLVKAIEGSRISIVVFSKHYASSRWCLDENWQRLLSAGKKVTRLFFQYSMTRILQMSGNRPGGMQKLLMNMKNASRKKWRRSARGEELLQRREIYLDMV
jgi:hypothetical protein